MYHWWFCLKLMISMLSPLFVIQMSLPPFYLESKRSQLIPWLYQRFQSPGCEPGPSVWFKVGLHRPHHETTPCYLINRLLRTPPQFILLTDSVATFSLNWRFGKILGSMLMTPVTILLSVLIQALKNLRLDCCRPLSQHSISALALRHSKIFKFYSACFLVHTEMYQHRRILLVAMHLLFRWLDWAVLVTYLQVIVH